jgi:NADPH2:quinone reductase
MAEQGVLLNEVARLVDAGTLRSTATERHAPINAANLKPVHALFESRQARGKIVPECFGAVAR